MKLTITFDSKLQQIVRFGVTVFNDQNRPVYQGIHVGKKGGGEEVEIEIPALVLHRTQRPPKT
jgi:hypothetical protein